MSKKTSGSSRAQLENQAKYIPGIAPMGTAPAQIGKLELPPALSAKANRLLTSVSDVDTVTRFVMDAVRTMFSFDEMTKLAQKNSFIALSYFMLLSNLNYVFLSPNAVSPAGSNPQMPFPFSISGKLAAAAECFRIQADNMNSMLKIDLFVSVFQGTNSAQIVQDGINAFLEGGRTIAAVAGGA